MYIYNLINKLFAETWRLHLFPAMFTENTAKDNAYNALAKGLKRRICL